MSLRLCVFDFDGTLTDVEKEAKPYIEGYKRDLAAILNKDIEEIVREWDRINAEIAPTPDQYGWKDEKGRVLVSAQADPYALCRTIANSLFDHYSVYQNQEHRAQLMGLLFRANYSITPVFKESMSFFFQKYTLLVILVSNLV